MAKSFQVNIITPEKTAFQKEAVSIIFPGAEGYVGAWANHAPLVTTVEPGVVWLKLNDVGDERYFAVSGGFCEISENKVNLMVEAAADARDIDLQAAREELVRARRELLDHDSAEVIDDVRGAVDRAAARVKAAEKNRKR